MMNDDVCRRLGVGICLAESLAMICRVVVVYNTVQYNLHNLNHVTIPALAQTSAPEDSSDDDLLVCPRAFVSCR